MYTRSKLKCYMYFTSDIPIMHDYNACINTYVYTSRAFYATTDKMSFNGTWYSVTLETAKAAMKWKRWSECSRAVRCLNLSQYTHSGE